MCRKVAEEYGYPFDVVKLAYKTQYKFIIDKIRGLDLSIDMTKEEFDKLRTNFSLLDLGKLYCTWDNIQKRKRYFRDVLPKVRRGGYKKDGAKDS